jgi:DNA-binding helix-hairpin-helix protein with protein kinase domain
MTSITGRDVLVDGARLRLAARPLSQGAQARVFRVEDDDEVVVKLYREPPDPRLRRKLEAMAAMSPLDDGRTAPGQPPELAWPTGLARDADGRVLGYAMPVMDEPEHVRLVALFNRAQRLRLFPGHGDWGFLLGVAWNLAFMVERLHREGLVVGDFSSNNIVVDRDGFVTFLDCDSMAFASPATGEVFATRMYTGDYAPPERQTGAAASVESDDFALAVLVYQLLAAGSHPFAGVPRGSHGEGDEEATVQGNITAARSYVVRPERVHTPRGILDPRVLPPSLLELARLTFGTGVRDPAARPAAREWLLALHEERSRVRRCRSRPRHRHGAHLGACPWCALAADGRDPFNPPDQAPPAARTRGGHAVTAALALALLLVLAVLAALVLGLVSL